MKKFKTQCELEVWVYNFKWTRYCNFDDELTIKPTVAREVYDVTGAGDTVIASIICFIKQFRY